MRPALATEGSGAAPLAVRLGRTLAIGTVGGAIFAWVNLPLAWMLGAMVATTAASLGGARLYVPGPMRSIMVAIIGVLLGASFTPEIVEKAREWPLTIGCLLLYLGFLIGILFLYFHRIVGLDPATAYFSAAPGGLSEMVITGAAMGADDRTIALIHTARVLLVVLAVPLWFRYTTGVTTTPSAIGPSIGAIGLTDIAVLTTCAIAGVVAGRLIRLPAYRLSGPLLASAFVHVTGINESAPPWELVAAAQVVVGSAIGARFTGVPVHRVLGLTAVCAGFHGADARRDGRVRARACAGHRARLAAHRPRLCPWGPGRDEPHRAVARYRNRVRRDPPRHPDRTHRGRGAARLYTHHASAGPADKLEPAVEFASVGGLERGPE